jgi:hypothetical protein
MEDAVKLHNIVRDSILLGYSRETTFVEVCRTYDNQTCKIDLKILRKWFKRHSNDFVIHEHYRILIETIRREFRLAKYSVNGRRCIRDYRFPCNLQLISERYALDTNGQSSDFPFEIYLIDMWYGRRRFVFLERAVKTEFCISWKENIE